MLQLQITDPSCPPCGITESQIPMTRKKDNSSSQTHPVHHEEPQNLKYQWWGNDTIPVNKHSTSWGTTETQIPMTRKKDNYRSQTHPVHHEEPQNLKYQWRGNVTITNRRHILSTMRNHRISNTNDEVMPQLQIAVPSSTPCDNYRLQTHPVHHEEPQNLKYQWRGNTTITDHRPIQSTMWNHTISNTNDEVIPQLQITDLFNLPWGITESQIPMTR